MSASYVHQCECPNCQQETPHADQSLHRRINLLLSRLYGQHHHWYFTIETDQVGPGRDDCFPQITDVDPKTIQQGRQELASSLAGCPKERFDLLAVVAFHRKKIRR